MAKRRRHSFLDSVYFARRGVALALRQEFNMRVQLVAFGLVMGLAWLLGISRVELAIIIVASATLVAAELVNSAIEVLADIVQPAYSDHVRQVKDMAAGAVLVVSLGAAGLGIVILGPLVLAYLAQLVG